MATYIRRPQKGRRHETIETHSSQPVELLPGKRYSGKLVDMGSRGYGYLSVSGAKQEVFVHCSEFQRVGDKVPPPIGTLVQFTVRKDRFDRLSAVQLEVGHYDTQLGLVLSYDKDKKHGFIKQDHSGPNIYFSDASLSFAGLKGSAIIDKRIRFAVENDKYGRPRAVSLNLL